MNNIENNTSKPSYRYAVISIAIVLYFLGLYLMLFLQSSKIDQKIKEQVSVVVELNDDTNKSEREALQETIKKVEGVIKSSVSFRDQSEVDEVMGEGVLDGFREGESPFRDIIIFRLYAKSYTDKNLRRIESDLQKERVVLDLYYESESDVGIHDFIQKLSLLFLILSIVFVGLALIIIHNTLSLSLYADRWEIKTMELVGARKAFIRKPYVAHGRIIGQRAFAVSALLLMFTMAIAYFSLSMVSSVFYWPYLIATLILLFLISTLITMISTFTVVNRFLDQKLSDLYI